MFTFLNKCTTISTINSIPRTPKIYYSYHKLFYLNFLLEFQFKNFQWFVRPAKNRRFFSLYFIAFFLIACFLIASYFDKVYRFELLKSKDPWTKFVEHEFYDFFDSWRTVRSTRTVNDRRAEADEPTNWLTKR